MFIAVRSNECAASVGVDVARTKLLAFAVSAFIAGIGGGLLAYQQGNVNSSSFVVWTSLTILAITYVGGIGRIAGAVAAGFLLASNGVMATLLDQRFSFNQYQALIAGLAMMLTAVANPDGIAKEVQGTYDKIGALIARRRGHRRDGRAGPRHGRHDGVAGADRPHRRGGHRPLGGARRAGVRRGRRALQQRLGRARRSVGGADAGGVAAETLRPGIPSGRFGEPWEVARLAALLASDAAGYINGADIAIDGGVTAVTA